MKTLITASEYSDVDGVACAFAYASYLQQKTSEIYEVKFGRGIHIEPEFVLSQLKIEYDLLSDKDIYESFILVDVCEPRGLPTIIQKDKVVEVIDHRSFPVYDAFPNAQFRIEAVGACATQIAEFFYFDKKILLSQELASLLLCAIYSNTVNFQSDTTTFRDLRMKKWLEETAGEKYTKLPEEMYKFKTEFAKENLKKIMLFDGHIFNGFIHKGIECVVYQIETADAKSILERKNEMQSYFKELFPLIREHLVLIQDAKEGKTILYSNQEDILAVAETVIPNGIFECDTYTIPKTMMRKSIKNAFINYQQKK
ncbi:MAG: DHH family phosphoesterase [Candidatus Roizmanbacteria bacterium]